jgi:predicted metal-dependent HD superfamily phosphohydrolase
MHIELRAVFTLFLESYTSDIALIDKLWHEIEQAYSGPERYYHTLEHIKNVLEQLLLVKDNINDWDTVLFSLFYHDVVYKASRSDNEEQSAVLAEERMNQLSVAKEKILQCKKQILATKSHVQQAEKDINYFTDADLAVLGQEWNVYEQYFKQVRKEYAIYPDFLYNPGRKKVLNHFLQMQRIFKTDYFFETLEIQAKSNLQGELKFLENKS